MAISKIHANQVRFRDPNAVTFFPWESGTMSANGYDIHDIVGDTFSLTQDDAERNEIPWEFGDTPLDENTSLGNRTVTMQCLDFQNDIMTTIFGCETKDGSLVFPKDYKDLYCTIVLSFDDRAIVMPKVKMDAKTVIENLRSDIARGEFSGTLYSTEVTFKEATTSGAGDAVVADTPLFFIPNGKSFTIGSHKVTLDSDNGSLTVA